MPSEDATNGRLFTWISVGRLALLVLLWAGTFLLPDRLGDVSMFSPRLAVLLGAAVLLSGLYIGWHRTRGLGDGLIWTQTLLDVLLVTAAVALTGGLSSPFTFLYPLVIITACLLAGRRGGTVTALLSTVLYAAVSWSVWDMQFPLAQAAFGFFANMAAFNVTASLGIVLAGRLRQTEIRLSETQMHLRRMEEVHRHLANSLRSGLITVDQNGTITSSNQAAADILGGAFSRVYGRPLRELWPAGARMMDHSAIEESDRQELMHISAEGVQKCLGISTFPLTDERGDLLGYGLIFQDITGVKAREEKLQRMDRLAALGEMASGLAHEIRNPLASLSGAAQFLQEAGLVLPEGKRLLKIIARESHRLNDLSRTFLLYARPEGRRNETVVLHREVEYVLSLLRQRRGLPPGELALDVPEDLEFELDPDQLRQVLLNLLLNAHQALPPEGGHIAIRGRREQGHIVIEIEDDGRGIRPEDLTKIFNPFFTTRPDGTGLGLAIVHRLVQAWGGDIAVRSEPGAGTTVTLRLPRSPSAPRP